jgi:hypothetical protein
LLFPTAAGEITAHFDPPICLENNTLPVVVVLDIADSDTGFAVYGGNAAGQTAPFYIKATACGINTFATMASIGFPDEAWVVNLNGDLTECGGGTPCPGDLVEPFGEVNGADLAALLGAWGTSDSSACIVDCPVDGNDLAALLGAWGACPN